MSLHLARYEMRVPHDLGDAVEAMARQPGEWKPFAGGTDLMVLLPQGKLPHRKFLSLSRIAEMRGVEVAHSHVTIGALTTYAQLQRDPVLQHEFPLLCRAASETGSIANQNRGTLGGNIANASPAADSPPALIVYDAELELVSTRARRWLPYAEFHGGYKQMNMAPDELIRSIRLPRTGVGWQQYYRKVGTRKAQAISKVCFAGLATLSEGRIGEIRIALGSVAPTVLRCRNAEAILRQSSGQERLREAQEQLAAEIDPVDDFRSNARYRTRVAQNLLAEFLLHLEQPANSI